MSSESAVCGLTSAIFQFHPPCSCCFSNNWFEKGITLTLQDLHFNCFCQLNGVILWFCFSVRRSITGASTYFPCYVKTNLCWHLKWCFLFYFFFPYQVLVCMLSFELILPWVTGPCLCLWFHFCIALSSVLPCKCFDAWTWETYEIVRAEQSGNEVLASYNKTITTN